MTGTPGPYRATGDVWVITLPEHLVAVASNADMPAETLADLMNKGEHFNDLLGALEELYEQGTSYAIFSDDIGSSIQKQVLSALAKARGEEGRS